MTDGTIDSTLLEGIGNGLNVIEKISSAKPEFSRAGAVSTSLKKRYATSANSFSVRKFPGFRV